MGSSATSRFAHNMAKESPMLPLRTRSIDSKSKKQLLEMENINVDTDVRITKLQPRPLSVQTFQVQDEKETGSKLSHPSALTPDSIKHSGYKESTLTVKKSEEKVETFIGSSLKRAARISDKVIPPPPPPKPQRDQGQVV